MQKQIEEFKTVAEDFRRALKNGGELSSLTCDVFDNVASDTYAKVPSDGLEFDVISEGPGIMGWTVMFETSDDGDPISVISSSTTKKATPTSPSWCFPSRISRAHRGRVSAWRTYGATAPLFLFQVVHNPGEPTRQLIRFIIRRMVAVEPNR